LGLCALPFLLSAQGDDGFVRLTPEDIAWRSGTTPGTSVAVLAGNPEAEGFYLIRVKFPPGQSSPPHYHPNDRHVTVISGTWYTGTGGDYDMQATVPLGPGSYMKHPAGAVHFDGAKDEEVVVEIKGLGPAQTIRVGQ
jgi:quercetin dioxygenase-like cupin family protein